MSRTHYPKSVIGIEITLDELETNFSFEWEESDCYNKEEEMFDFDTFQKYFESKNPFFEIHEVNGGYTEDAPLFLIGLRTKLFLENPKLLPQMLKELRDFLNKKDFENQQINLVANFYTF